MKNYYLKFLSWLMPNETNLTENKHQILLLLKHSNFIKLSVKEQIELFKSIEIEFYNNLAKQNLEAQIILTDIEEFLTKKSKEL